MFKKNSAIVLGLMPYSSIGYTSQTLEQNNEIVGYTGDLKHTNYGLGNMYQLFAGGAVLLWDRLSLGAQWVHYFGYTQKTYTQIFNNSSFSGVSDTYSIDMRADAAKFGLQYEQPVGQKTTIGIGATYSLGTNLKGYVEDYRYSSGSSQNDTISFHRDTLAKMNGAVNIPSEIGIGISVNYDDNLRAEINYLRSDWTTSGMDVARGFAVKGASSFSTRISESYRAGVEFVPNRNDIRYYLKTCTYRAGLYYDKSYYAVDGNQVNDIGVTLGASFPVFRYYNAVTVAVSAGQRSSMAGNMIRERYVNFTVGFNFFDYWFHKMTYN